MNVTWSLIELDKHPESLKKLMAEINSVDTNDFTNINSKMPYLDAVIMEINRLHPTVHATLRVVNRETKLASSKKVPVVLKPGMLIYLSYFYLHTSEKFWGPDAGEFVPERFIGGYKKDQPFMSFGYGPRNCVSFRGYLKAGTKKANISRLATNLPSSRQRSILSRSSRRSKWTLRTMIMR